MAPRDRSTASTLKRTYESGEWSDLTIFTATRDFRVHKNIVCPACPFFEAACTRDSKEARTGVVKLPESAETVKGILKFIYGFPVRQATAEHAAASDIDHLCECLDIHVAADKYDLPGLRTISRRAVTTYVRCLDLAQKMVDFGLYLYQQDPGAVDESIIRKVTMNAGLNLPFLRVDESTWRKFVGHYDFLTASMDQLLKSKSALAVDDPAVQAPGDPEQKEDVRRFRDGLKALRAQN
ncbi:hypothetical protein CBER1_11199 [Cercospora berteroae]|uniref:BTB domain-containing protein n=1 Tax=Cercospora berteroae TaxID=357750 RepID=A0A2S6BZG6_9PEZI|nr:hypothetical protein CBER1_11199 [Cercospora berteroae]